MMKEDVVVQDGYCLAIREYDGYAVVHLPRGDMRIAVDLDDARIVARAWIDSQQVG